MKKADLPHSSSILSTPYEWLQAQHRKDASLRPVPPQPTMRWKTCNLISLNTSKFTTGYQEERLYTAVPEPISLCKALGSLQTHTGSSSSWVKSFVNEAWVHQPQGWVLPQLTLATKTFLGILIPYDFHMADIGTNWSNSFIYTRCTGTEKCDLPQEMLLVIQLLFWFQLKLAASRLGRNSNQRG